MSSAVLGMVPRVLALALAKWSDFDTSMIVPYLRGLGSSSSVVTGEYHELLKRESRETVLHGATPSRRPGGGPHVVAAAALSAAAVSASAAAI